MEALLRLQVVSNFTMGGYMSQAARSDAWAWCYVLNEHVEENDTGQITRGFGAMGVEIVAGEGGSRGVGAKVRETLRRREYGTCERRSRA